MLFPTAGDLKVMLINQVHHHLDFVELVHADFVFLLLARKDKSKLLFCSCFVRRFGIAHASMALRSLNHNLDHYILFFCLALSNHKSERHEGVIGKALGADKPAAKTVNDSKVAILSLNPHCPCTYGAMLFDA